jgi:hypothetical protein
MPMNALLAAGLAGCALALVRAGGSRSTRMRRNLNSARAENPFRRTAFGRRAGGPRSAESRDFAVFSVTEGQRARAAPILL